MRKLTAEIEAGRTKWALVLAKHDHSTKWWHEIVAPHGDLVLDLWQLHRRVRFDPPPGIEPSTNNFCSSIIHWRPYTDIPLNLCDIATLWQRGK
jgi:hypothetical protein